MNRPRIIWIVFVGCAAIVLAVLGWLSRTALHLERAQVEATLRAEEEERLRLALWRLDSAVAPLIIEESSRPWSAYQPFPASPLAVTRDRRGFNRAQAGDVFVASPLLAFTSTNILLHFQFRPGQPATSPQVPENDERPLAESGYVSKEQIERATTRLSELRRLLAQDAVRPAQWMTLPSIDPHSTDRFNNSILLMQASGLTNTTSLNMAAAASGLASVQDPAAMATNAFRNSMTGQRQRSVAEFQQRATLSQLGQQIAVEDSSLMNNAVSATGPSASPGADVFKPIWVGDALMLVRRVMLDRNSVVQGVWLNWTNLQPALLATVADLLPKAELRPATAVTDGHEARLLASLPVQIIPGGNAVPEQTAWTALRLTLLIAWIAVGVAAMAIARLLYGTVSLSERRAAFVSAVTHEMRTPLMTFRMYSEMLADGMVPEEKQRRQYLDTLCAEANRLSHLVENVLAYARLERRGAPDRIETLSLSDVIARMLPRLRQRAEQAGFTLTERIEPKAASAELQADVSAVEHILFNLVDNACKYAAASSSPARYVIQLEAFLDDPKRIRLLVRDHGPGVSPAAARRLFQPFSKSADEAAHTAPGVGLGLALCRRLSRSMGGDLRWTNDDQGGACFELTLPTEAAGRARIG